MKYLFRSFVMAMVTVLISISLASCSEDSHEDELLPPIAAEWEIYNQDKLQDLSKDEYGINLYFETNYDWRIEIEYMNESKDWCILSQSEGYAGTASIGLTIIENKTYDYRIAVVSLICKNEKRSFTIRQRGTPEPATVVSEIAGTLRQKLGNVHPEVESLTIEGSINGDDIAALRDFYSNTFALKSLNLLRVKMVKGGSFEYKGNVGPMGGGGWHKETCDEDNVIPDNMFNTGFRGLEELILPMSITAIGRYALGECQSLKKIQIPSMVTKIDVGAFTDCFDLELIFLPPNLKSIGAGAFKQCGLISIDIPEGITKIASNTFCQCRRLEHVKLPESLTEIEPMAFSQCTFGLYKITIPKNVKKIGYQAFYECKQLSSVTCLSETPPQIRDVFSNGTLMYPFDEGVRVNLFVPKFSLEFYRDSDWNKFCYIKELNN